jgi:hypothetical protein
MSVCLCLHVTGKSITLVVEEMDDFAARWTARNRTGRGFLSYGFVPFISSYLDVQFDMDVCFVSWAAAECLCSALSCLSSVCPLPFVLS